MRSNIRFLLMACLAVGLGSGCGDTSETKAADAATSDAAKVGDTQGDVPVGSDAVDAITDNGAQDTPDGAVVSDVPVVLDAAADAAADATATDAPVAVDGGGDVSTTEGGAPKNIAYVGTLTGNLHIVDVATMKDLSVIQSWPAGLPTCINCADNVPQHGSGILADKRTIYKVDPNHNLVKKFLVAPDGKSFKELKTFTFDTKPVFGTSSPDDKYYITTAMGSKDGKAISVAYVIDVKTDAIVATVTSDSFGRPLFDAQSTVAYLLPKTGGQIQVFDLKTLTVVQTIVNKAAEVGGMGGGPGSGMAMHAAGWGRVGDDGVIYLPNAQQHNFTAIDPKNPDAQWSMEFADKMVHDAEPHGGTIYVLGMNDTPEKPYEVLDSGGWIYAVDIKTKTILNKISSPTRVGHLTFGTDGLLYSTNAYIALEARDPVSLAIVKQVKLEPELDVFTAKAPDIHPCAMMADF